MPENLRRYMKRTASPLQENKFYSDIRRTTMKKMIANMRNWYCAFFLMGAFLFLLPGTSESLLPGDDFCWKNTYTRDFGYSPMGGQCDPGLKKFAGLCYEPCKAGFVDGGVSVCLPNSYKAPHPFGYPARLVCHGSWPWQWKCTSMAYQDCRAANPGHDCFQGGALWYPECDAGYTNTGFFCVNKEAPYTRSPSWPNCNSGDQVEAGLCHKPCSANHTGVGPLCVDQCPSGWTDCGLACSSDGTGGCVGSVANMAMSSAQAIGTLAAALPTGGASLGAGEAVNAAKEAETAAKTASTVEKLTAQLSKLEKTLKELKAAHPDAVKAARVAYYADKVNTIQQSIRDKEYRAAITAAASLDPTGISSAIDSFVHGKCD